MRLRYGRGARGSGAGPGTSAVDVGCGAGRAVAGLVERGVTAVGVDPGERMIAVARARWPEADFRYVKWPHPALSSAYRHAVVRLLG